MSHKFICYLIHDQNKFNMIISQDQEPSETSFGDIFAKIGQIFKYALRRRLEAKSCIFELTDCSTGESSIIRSYDQKIRHMSVITMRDKPCPRGFISKNDPAVIALARGYKDIEAMKLIVEMIDPEDDFNVDSDQSWRRLFQRLVVRYSYTFRDYNPEMCRSLFSRMTMFYIINYSKLNLQLVPELQIKFDMLKVIHRLDLDKVFSKEIATTIRTIGQNQEIQDYLYLYNTYGVDMYQNYRLLSLDEPMSSKHKRKARHK